ncbi:MBL fold metallo-hydrolase [Arenicella xantha]|uniref:Glyoxylase-like metal-dependent hydrolase (Beta-lactamase superfamily II) n=1 Tax=Arenicella xantha TaxID=644221 RepID=A0A395JQ07_9GAMM|nr:MBL fold metallo-hydrolase [Arenicella xantha]RBP53734.1 glyoxylase-like metal-dependent hydrolase (beta-lactamase superfamily II) [Arenicella xantha]
MTHNSRNTRPTEPLDYPFKRGWSPEPGVPFEVADGVFWLRMPLPIALDHINLWLLKEHDGWTIVDSGYDSDLCKSVWDQVFDTMLAPNDVKRVIVTHFHPDHIGLAAWLAARCDCPILISKGEFELYHSIHTRDQSQVASMVNDYLQELGYEQDVVERFLPFFLSEEKPKSDRVQPEQCVFIQEADAVLIRDRSWQVVTGNGHSPEHSCLYCAELGVMISGDQAIPRISSNVSVYPANRHADPLGDWITSCEKLRDSIPNDTLILPSHQEPFYGIAQRMQHLIDDHHEQLNELRLAVQAPISAIQARSVLFNRKLSQVDTLLATGETLAHLNFLLHRNEIAMQLNQQGVALYAERH